MIKKNFIAIFIIFLLLALPVNASISFNQYSNQVYSIEDRGKEKIIPLKINKISNEVTDNYNLNIDIYTKNLTKIINPDIKIDSISIENITLPSYDIKIDSISIENITLPSYDIKIDSISIENIALPSYDIKIDPISIENIALSSYDIKIDSLSRGNIVLPVNLHLSLYEKNLNTINQFDISISDQGITIIKNLSKGLGIASVQDDTLWVWTDKSSYDETETIVIGRGMGHDDPAEIITENLTLIKSDNSQRSLGIYNWNIPGYSSLYLQTLSLAASSVLDAMGGGNFFIRSVVYSSDGESIGANSNWFNVQYSGNELVVQGYVEDENGVKVSGATVMFTDCSDNLVVSDVTDINGYFKLETIAGSYKLKVTYNGVTYTFTIGGNECNYYQPGTLNLNSPLTITTKSTLTGTVQDEDGNKVQGAVVKWTDCSDNPVASDTTDSNGDFSLTALAGNYKLKVTYNGVTYTFTIGGNECNYYQPGTLNLNSPLTITTKSTLTGTVQDEDGNKVQGAVVKWTDCSDNPVASDTTDSNGDFSLTADPGNYKFKIIVDYGGRLVTLSYNFDGGGCPYWQVGYLQFSNPFVILSTFTLYGYLKDLDDNPLENYDIELYDCSENFIDNAPTDLNGYFSITKDVGEYKIMINMGSGWKMKLVDQDDNDCFFLFGDINIGTLNINPTADCSVFDYSCYQDDIKLFNCYWNEEERGCYCYGTQCSYGCTDGLEGCDSGSYGTIVVDVDNINNNYNPLLGAQVYLDNNYQGTTGSLGKKYLDAVYGYRVVKVNCPNGNYCSSKDVYVDSNYEYTYFDCGCGIQTGDVNLFVYNVNRYPLVNVIVYLDGDEKGYTNPFGQIHLEDISYGNHNLKLEVYVSKEPSYKGTLEQSLLVDSEYKVEEITLREEDLTKYDFQMLYKEDGYTPQVAPIIVYGMAVVDIASVTYSATELCKCVYKTDKLVGGAAECVDTLNKCSLSGFNVDECIQGIQEFGSISDDCFWETAFLAGDAASPLIPAGFIGHFIVKVGKKFSWVDNAERGIRKVADNVWKYMKKWGGGIFEFFAKNTDQGIKKAVKLGTYNLIEWSDEALQGLEKIISKGGQKSGHGLIRYLGEEGAEKLSKNIDSLSKKGIKGFDSSVHPKGLLDEISDAAKDLEEKILRGKPDSVIVGARGRLKGLIFEAEVAANPKYLDNVAELRRFNTKAPGEIDMVLKNGDIIEVKSWTFPINSDKQQLLRKQFNWARLEFPSKTLKFVFKNPPDDDTVELLKKMGALREVLE